ncbi:MAG: ACT domain-containing protein [Chloroflexota bacterium]|nr:ACT domain-containing protein [Chloroflexota bacterium]
MTHTADSALKAALLETDETVYVVIHLAPNGIMAACGILAQIGEPFAALIVDRHEVTLIIPAEVVEDYHERLRDHRLSSSQYRLITFDVVLDYPVVGFMARIAAALAAAGVSIMPYGAFERDHLLVPVEQFETALHTLRILQASNS